MLPNKHQRRANMKSGKKLVLLTSAQSLAAAFSGLSRRRRVGRPHSSRMPRSAVAMRFGTGNISAESAIQIEMPKFGESSRYALVAALMVLFLPACAGSAPRSTAPILGTRFSAKVVALCESVLAEKKAEPPFPFAAFNPTTPDLSKLPAIGRYESR